MTTILFGWPAPDTVRGNDERSAMPTPESAAHLKNVLRVSMGAVRKIASCTQRRNCTCASAESPVTDKGEPAIPTCDLYL